MFPEHSVQKIAIFFLGNFGLRRKFLSGGDRDFQDFGLGGGLLVNKDLAGGVGTFFWSTGGGSPLPPPPPNFPMFGQYSLTLFAQWFTPLLYVQKR